MRTMLIIALAVAAVNVAVLAVLAWKPKRRRQAWQLRQARDREYERRLQRIFEASNGGTRH